MTAMDATIGAETLVLGYAVFDYTQHPTLETLYAQFPDGRIAATEARRVLPVFADPATTWRYVPAIPHRAEYIGLYPAPTVTA